MTLPSGLGMPDDDEAWLVREVQALRQRIEEVANSVGQDGVTISSTGALRVKGTDGAVDVFYAGTFRDDPTLNDPTTGARQRGVELRRNDGTLALELAEYAADNGTAFRQALALRDAAGAVIVAEDSDSGTGIARPWLLMGIWTDARALGVTAGPTDSAEWTTLQVAHGYRQHPKATVYAIVSSDTPDTTGEVALFDENDQLLTSTTVEADTLAYVQVEVTWPAGWEFGSGGLFALKARRTAGTGTVGVRGVSFHGRQS